MSPTRIVLSILAALAASTASGACTVEQIAGTYASQFGTIDCKVEDGDLQCCYEDVRSCKKQLRLALNSNGREVNGQWSERGQTGPAKFMLSPQCDLIAGRWGSGPRPTARWMVNQRTSPRPILAATTGGGAAKGKALQTNGRGELLHSGKDFSIYTLLTSKNAPNSWCSELSFRVSAEFERDASFVFAPELIHDELFRELLPTLRARHCPKATQNISARLYLKNTYFGPRGTRKSAEEAAKSTIANAPIVTASFYTDFRADPDARPADASRLNLLYNDNGVHRMRSTDSEVANLVGSADRLLEYWQRGGRTLEEYAVIQGRKAAVRARFQALEDAYGVALKSYDVVRILGGHGDELDWQSYDEWYFLRSYIQTTTPICGDKTVGTPYRGESYYANREGQRVEDSDVVLWYSSELRRKVKGRQIGSGLGGTYKPDATIKADIEALVAANGCASEPLARIERFFH